MIKYLDAVTLETKAYLYAPAEKEAICYGIEVLRKTIERMAKSQGIEAGFPNAVSDELGVLELLHENESVSPEAHVCIGDLVLSHIISIDTVFSETAELDQAVCYGESCDEYGLNEHELRTHAATARTMQYTEPDEYLMPLH